VVFTLEALEALAAFTLAALFLVAFAFAALFLVTFAFAVLFLVVLFLAEFTFTAFAALTLFIT
jgi:hypothetical protein